MAGYSDPLYIESLSEFGEPLWLPNSGIGLLLQEIPGTNRIDARGPYPLLTVGNWDAFQGDLELLQERSVVSFTAVLDPLVPTSGLALTFDLSRPYKEHFIVDLSKPYEGPFSKGHARNLQNARTEVVVGEVETPLDALEDWCGLYEDLVHRHEILGIAAFSHRSFEVQLQLPGMRVIRATRNGKLLGMTLWLQDVERAYYHLGASTAEGYEVGASFAMFDAALRRLREEGVREVLLGAGAGVIGDPSDGLSRFKAGWSTGSRTAHIIGKVLDEKAYRELSKGCESDYFPAYRSPNQSLIAA